jgi:hypothetical protein
MPTLRGFIAWFAPIAAGFAMLYFMVKPLFKKPADEETGIEITPDSQPLIYELLDQVVRSCNVPAPGRIFLDCSSEVRTWNTPKREGGSESPNLTIGLTLLCAVNVRQIGAAICSALARHGGTSAGAATVEKTSAWLTRVVTYRDSLDVTLDEFADKPNRIIRTLGIFLRWMVRLIRVIIRGMLYSVNGLGKEAVRWQYTSADFTGAQLCGPPEYTAMLMRSQSLRIARGIAERNLKRIITNSLPANFPAFVASSEPAIPKEVWRPFQQQMEHENAALPELEPGRQERIANLRRLDSAPLVTLNVPAQKLLAEFEETCGKASIRHYYSIYGDEYQQAWLRPNPEFMERIGYSVFLPSTYDTLIDYHEGDKWHVWRQRLSIAGGVLLSAGLVWQAGVQIRKAVEPEEAKYRRNIGKAVLVHHAGLRKIEDVKFVEKGESLGTETGDTDQPTAEQAAESGWFYDTGDGMLAECKTAVILDELSPRSEGSDSEADKAALLDSVKERADELRSQR